MKISFPGIGALLFVSVSSAAIAADQIKITSPAFAAGTEIPAKYTCNGANASPPLHFATVPAQAKSLAIIVADPDAPGGTFTHWIVWNIDPKTAELAENNLPPGAVRGTNDFGKSGYGGPCPPSGTHRYYYRVFALDNQLSLKPGAKAAEFEKAIAGHVLARGELMGRYSHR
jgi:Raf kinase inhibitor-like YbhB/YbcL family protein